MNVNKIYMTLKDKLTKPLYQNSFDGDSWHMYIKFENIDKILDEQVRIAEEHFKTEKQ